MPKARKNKTKQIAKPLLPKGLSSYKLIGLAFIFGIIGTVLLQTSRANTGDFTKVATHPQASQQSTAMGKTIANLTSWNGKLYAGYGDYNVNTGPISITPFDGSNFTSPELSSDTEAIWRYRVLNNRLFAPSTDPRVAADFAVGEVVSPTSATWKNSTPVHSTHAYDMTTLTGSDLWLVGSQGNDAVAWRSIDGGVTWQESLRVKPLNGSTGDFSRFYSVGVVGGKLYVQAVDKSMVAYPRSKVFDGSTWTDGNSLGFIGHAESVAGKMIYQAAPHAALFAGALNTFNGTSMTTVLPYVYDYTMDGSTVYALTVDGLIKKSQDLTSWTLVGTAPAVARSIGVLNGTIYVGGTDSSLYKFSGSATPPTTPDTVIPTVSLSQPTNGTVVGRRTIIKAIASDNVKVSKMEILIDGNPVTSSNTDSVGYTWNSQKTSPGPHVIIVKAFDAAGNSNQATVTVNK